MKKAIGIFTGSLRKESYSRKIAGIVSEMLSEHFEVKMISIGNLPIFNQDFDDENLTPGEWLMFRETVRDLDGFLFVTPEYNRSIPPVLKNALDIASRPSGENLWSGKPGGVISVSPGAIGGFGAHHHLRQVLSSLNVYTMPQPEMYIGNVAASLNEDGSLREERTRKYLQTFANALQHWVEMF